MINQNLNPYDYKRSTCVWTMITKDGQPHDYCDNIEDARKMVDRLNREHNKRVIRLHQLEEMQENDAKKFDTSAMLRYSNVHVPVKYTPKHPRVLPEAWHISVDTRGYIERLFNV